MSLRIAFSNAFVALVIALDCLQVSLILARLQEELLSAQGNQNDWPEREGSTPGSRSVTPRKQATGNPSSPKLDTSDAALDDAPVPALQQHPFSTAQCFAFELFLMHMHCPRLRNATDSEN